MSVSNRAATITRITPPLSRKMGNPFLVCIRRNVRKTQAGLSNGIPRRGGAIGRPRPIGGSPGRNRRPVRSPVLGVAPGDSWSRAGGGLRGSRASARVGPRTPRRDDAQVRLPHPPEALGEGASSASSRCAAPRQMVCPRGSAGVCATATSGGAAGTCARSCRACGSGTSAAPRGSPRTTVGGCSVS